MPFQKYAATTILEARMGGDQRGMLRTAHRHSFDYTPKEGMLYVRSRAISSRCNDNFDYFGADDIAKAYKSFVGKPVFVNHHNDNHRRMRGVIIDAALHRDVNPDGSPDTWAEVLMEVDAVRYPKLAKAILAGHVDRTSMGCDVELSKCSICHNVAKSPLEYCAHIPGKKGKRIYQVMPDGSKVGKLVYEICSGLSFFENSLLVEQPADPTAFFLGQPELGPGLEHLASSIKTTASVQAERDPMFYFRQNHRPFEFSKTASRKQDQSVTVWNLIKQADLMDDDLYDQDFRFIATGPVAGGPVSNNEDRHRLLDEKAGDGKGVRNLLNLVHQSARSDNDLHSGMKWYDDAHGVAKTIAEHHRAQEGHVFNKLSSADALHRTAGTIGVYSSSSAPAPNLHMAMDAIHHGQAVYSKPIKDANGKTVANSGFNPHGEGHEFDRKGLPMADDKGAAKINSMLQDGKSIDEAWKGQAHKTRNFSHLINNPDAVDEKGNDRVVVDRHAIAAVLGHKGSSGEVYDNPHGPQFASLLSTKGGYEKVAQHYRDAATHINSSDEFKPLREKLHGLGLLKPGDRVRAHHVQALTWVQQKKISGSKTSTKDQDQIDRFQGAYTHRYGDSAHKPTNWQGFVGGDDRHDKTGSRHPFDKLAYGETKAPRDVDTLRAENCTVCGNSTAFDGKQCQICGYVAPPKEFGDPDTDMAKQMDLRKQVLDGDTADPMDLDQEMGNQQGDPEEAEEQAEDANSGMDSSALLTCTNCGTGIQPAPPQTASEGAAPAFPAEGDVCPVCNKGELAGAAAASPGDDEGDPEGDPDADPGASGAPQTDSDDDAEEDADDKNADQDPDDDKSDDDQDDDDDDAKGSNPFAKKKSSNWFKRAFFLN